MQIHGLPSLLALSLLLAGPVHADDPVPLGPLGGAGVAVLVDPTNADRLLVSIPFVNELVVSTDGGLTFQLTGAGLPGGNHVRDLEPHPFNPAVVYAAIGTDVYVSADFGANWNSTGLAAGTTLRGVRMASNGATMLAYGSSQLWRSPDAGATWSQVAGITSVQSLGLAPSDASVAYLGNFNGVFRSSDGGLTFAPTAHTSWVKAVAVDPGDSNTLVIGGTGGSVNKSTDGGASFSPANNGIPTTSVQFLTYGLGSSQTVWAGMLTGLWRTTDAAASWADANAGIQPPVPIPMDMSEHSGGRIYLVTEGGGLYRSDTGSPPWTQVAFSNVDLYVAAIAQPGGDRLVTSEKGVYIGPPGGPLVPSGFFFDFGGNTNDLVVDPTNPDRWIFGGVGAFLDNAQIRVATNGGTNVALAYEAFGAGAVTSIAQHETPNLLLAGVAQLFFGGDGLVRSTDGGNTWSAVPGSASWPTVDVAFDPHASSHAVGLVNNGSYVESSDAGATFTQKFDWPLTQPIFIAFDPFAKDVIYLGDGVGGLMKTTDGGANWSSLGVTVGSRSTMAFVPGIPDVYWVGDAGGALLFSDDGGASHTPVFVPGAEPSGLALDPSDGTLLVATRGASAWELPKAAPFRVYGEGTAGTGGAVPRHYATGGEASVGNAGLAIEADQLLGGSVALLHIGGTEVALPFAGGELLSGPPTGLFKALATVGSPGVGGTGAIAQPLPVPNDASLIGLSVFSQVAVVDGAGQDGLALSAGLEVRIRP